MTDPLHRVILDVDTGIDDAVALALAVKLPRVDLVGVTTVAGNVNLELTTLNTLRVLDWVGASEVPVYPGAAAPLVGAHRDAAIFRGTDGLGNAAIPTSRRQAEAVTAPEFIVRAARESPGELDLVCVAPLTNLAIALLLEPNLPQLVRRTLIMGGAFARPGNETPYAEFNIYADPEAASAVARSSLEATWVGLDVTQRATLTRPEWERLDDAEEPPAVLVREVSRHSFTERGAPGFQLHDPLALLALVEPDVLSVKQWAIEVDCSVRETVGRTRLVRDPRAPQHRVALGVDARRFREIFDRTLGLDVAVEREAPARRSSN
jgi:purine nucleosidase